jgi:hypothetical protein
VQDGAGEPVRGRGARAPGPGRWRGREWIRWEEKGREKNKKERWKNIRKRRKKKRKIK